MIKSHCEMATTKLVIPLIRFARAVTQDNEQASYQQTEDTSLALIWQPSTNSDRDSETSIHIMRGTTILVTNGGL
jgi:hypothetical protein